MLRTLDEAIWHAKDIANNLDICDECRDEHAQLAQWLEELSTYRQTHELVLNHVSDTDDYELVNAQIPVILRLNKKTGQIII